ncbi:MAG: phosphoenolpyruvate carboxylase [Pseudohongiellaceae bacterium]
MSHTEIHTTYENRVELNYQLYNGLFLTLPLDAIEQTGLLLPLLEESCHKGLGEGHNPVQIIEQFFSTHRPRFSAQEQIQFLFKIVQYVERQVVLIDALEDAAFAEIHDTDAADELRKLSERVISDDKQQALAEILEGFAARVVLTAHPTQFYPGPVLAIITDLTAAIRRNDIALARNLLQQLGNTPFFNKEKPTPLDEATSLSWYLGNVFYPVISAMLDKLCEFETTQHTLNSTLLSIGFWPGGDRDGNPLVTADTTLAVGAKLRALIIERYHQDIRQLKRRLSFAGVYEALEAIEKRLNQELVHEAGACFPSAQALLDELDVIADKVSGNYQGLFLEQLRSLQRRIQAFGFYFASLDIRQDSRVLAGALESIRQAQPRLFPADYESLDENKRLDSLFKLKAKLDPASFDDAQVRDTLASMQALRELQRRNGERSCHRYIISNCRGAADIANLMALFRLSGWHNEPLSVDLVPLFETINDLEEAGQVMQHLYGINAYAAHLKQRGQAQTVMLGFSDGTKDGGYLMANWAIYRGKEDITAASRKANIEVAFFDGRGGPPGRGGGNTYRFYAALGKSIESNQIQLTVQGQTISSYYGTLESAGHNLRQLLAAGLENNLYNRPEREITDEQRTLISQLAEAGYASYQSLKAHALFVPYLLEMSTLRYYSLSNIASRPARRGKDDEFRFEDLRAIPFVGAWGQLKQNVPGFFGIGTALEKLAQEGKLEECKQLYQNSHFFRTLLDNSMQSMSKADFELTRYMENDETYGELWRLIHAEYLLSKEMALKVSGLTELLEDNPRSQLSIKLRQRIVLPSLIIQQFGMMKLRETRDETKHKAKHGYSSEVLEKLVIRSMFGNINASRNSA